MLRALLILGFGAAVVAAAALTWRSPAPGEATLVAATEHGQAQGEKAQPVIAPLQPLPPGPDVGDLRLAPTAEGMAAAAPEPEPRRVRDVTPAGVTAPPRVTGPLTRVAPPPKPSQPTPELEARAERLFNPVVIAAGTIRARGEEIRLAGIDAPEFEARCGEGASAWPCGRMARAALRRFIRGRAIECHVPAGAAKIPDSAACNVAGQGLAEWLVAQGWAKGVGPVLSDEERKARERKLGLWASARPDGSLAAIAERVP